jgi:hypothetical protein
MGLGSGSALERDAVGEGGQCAEADIMVLMETVVDADGEKDEFIESIRLIPGHQLVLDGLSEHILECSLKGLLMSAAFSGEGAKLTCHLSNTMVALTEGQESFSRILTADQVVKYFLHLLCES